MDLDSNEILKELLPAGQDAQALAETPRPGPHNSADHWSPVVLLERAAALREQARCDNGSASETLNEYPRHSAMLSFRNRDGEAELHENFADIFYVLDGRATLVTGGTIDSPARIGPGELRGSAVKGGQPQHLRAGDVAHVPSGVPHQMLVAAGQTVTSLVMKIRET